MSESKRLSQERLAELEAHYESLAEWRGRIGSTRPNQSEGRFCDLWQHSQALEAENAKLRKAYERIDHDRIGIYFSYGLYKAARFKLQGRLRLARRQRNELQQELAQANSYLSIFDCAECNHPYVNHEGFGLRCKDCFCDGYIAHREIIESREAIAKLKQELAAARARIAELEEYIRCKCGHLATEHYGFNLPCNECSCDGSANNC